MTTCARYHGVPASNGSDDWGRARGRDLSLLPDGAGRVLNFLHLQLGDLA
jgi:hypothetical protein